jgi:predicted nucleic acid-binding protein
MITFVLDASVAAKWFLPSAGEPLSDEAFQLLQRQVNGELQFMVPDLFWSELGNILWKAVWQQRIHRTAAEEAMSAVREQNLGTIPSRELIVDAFALANDFRRSVYDCVYVIAAITQRSTLVTADQRLANALGGPLPVKWLGAI